MKFYIQLVIILIVLGSLWFVLNKNQTPSFSEGKIQWINQFHEGLQLAKEQKKPVLIFFSASWCYWCRKLNQDVFMNDQVASLSDSFITVLIDVDKHPEWAKKFNVRGVPDVYFIDHTGKKVIQYTGNRLPEDMLVQMRSALEKLDTTSTNN
ncbi:MAG: thioredoxin family protein [Candidatus Magnetomorum sp.]|nr:thioredoxin family protein [Candidatus Magnetomorum sp.]